LRGNTVYVKLFAGLGNQLFQYAYGESLRASGRSVRYILAPSAGCITEVFDIPREGITSSSNPIVILAAKLAAKFVFRSYEVGYFQNREYAKSLSGTLRFRRESAYRALPAYERIKGGESVAVHVRGGDYVKDTGSYAAFGSVCDRTYYDRAIEAAHDRIAGPRYFVFTDDRSHAESVLPDEFRGKAEFVEDVAADPGAHLFLMSECRHAIIANSTFSWWAANLAPRPGKVVVAPSKWGAGLCLPDWVLV
jgi:hypothetical protein